MLFFVITEKNPINALLALITCFAFSSLLLCCFELIYFAIIFITIYIGAIAIFFLFIIMFINIQPSAISGKNFIFIAIIIFFFFKCFFLSNEMITFNFFVTFDILNLFHYQLSIDILSIFLYSYYSIFIFYIAILLFLTMLGAIMLIIQAE